MTVNALNIPLTRDRDLAFPEFVLLKASAGAGKTHNLSLRFVQFLLSDAIRRTLRTTTKDTVRADLRNLLAITFTRNAAREMKERILDWLKQCHFGDPAALGHLLAVVSAEPSDLRARAAETVESILSHYSDFQVETIDSFMTSVFDASTVDLGVSPDYEISLDASETLDYAFQRYLRGVGPETREGKTFLDIARTILGFLKEEGAFVWDPASAVLENIKSLHSGLMSQTGELAVENYEKKIAGIHVRMARFVDEIASSGLELNDRSNFKTRMIPAVERRRFADFLGVSFKTEPVKKPRADGEAAAYDKAIRTWAKLESAVNAYRGFFARGFFYPYLAAYKEIERTLEEVKGQRGVVFLEDVYQKMFGLLKQGTIPDVYFRLGEQIFHYLIDEFQDTSPIQWADLAPLIENSLSVGGSLFLVGDTKQAIYGFRYADFEIQAGLEHLNGRREPFPSVETQVREIGENYRSYGHVLDFVKEIFLEKVKTSEEYGAVATQSGLTNFTQDVRPERLKEGFAEYVQLDKDEDDPPEKRAIQECVLDLRSRGYKYSDIGILTLKNDSVVRIASWLNEIREEIVPFIPYSSLDIRKRKITGEILALLRFLDSPPDDLAFATFLLSDILAERLAASGLAAKRADWTEFARRFIFDCRLHAVRPLYTAFRKARPDLWESYFEPFFKSVGYSPLYDLVTEIFRVFGLFESFPEEEAALAKFLEAIKDFEGIGKNDLAEFLSSAANDTTGESSLDIDVSLDIDAVKVMSIHKAKGLGFTAVILLLYGEKFQAPDFYLTPGDGQVRVLRLTKELAEADAELKARYKKERDRDVVDRLNTLYVALTRAKRELHVIGVKGSRDKYPFDLLEGMAGRVFGSKQPIDQKGEAAPSFDVRRVRFAEVADRPLNPREILSDRSIRRGIIGHEIMAAMDYLRDGWERDVRRVLDRLAIAADERDIYEDAGRAIVAFFKDSPLAELFDEKPDRRVFTEYDVCDELGRTLRLDRVVVDDQNVVILDYKTGFAADPEKQAAREAEDKAQMDSYLRVMKAVFPEKTVEGVLAYIDRGRSERVS